MHEHDRVRRAAPRAPSRPVPPCALVDPGVEVERARPRRVEIVAEVCPVRVAVEDRPHGERVRPRPRRRRSWRPRSGRSGPGAPARRRSGRAGPGRPGPRRRRCPSSTSASRPPAARSTRARRPGSGSATDGGTGSPRNHASTRRTRSSISSSFHLLHTAFAGRERVGLGERGEQLERLARPDRPRRPCRSSPGRSGRGSWRRTRPGGARARASRGRATSSAPKPSRGAIFSMSSTPASVWSPGEPLPRSCSHAPTSSRSGRTTSRVSRPACTTASTRCRSTV